MNVYTMIHHSATDVNIEFFNVASFVWTFTVTCIMSNLVTVETFYIC
jgi:hypothetical protein